MDQLRQHALEFATIAIALIVVGAGLVVWRLRQRLLRSEHERRRAADELNRRLSELFSLQELSYVLSDSLELDRIVEQVVRYAVRFLDAQGALLALLGIRRTIPCRSPLPKARWPRCAARRSQGMTRVWSRAPRAASTSS